MKILQVLHFPLEGAGTGVYVDNLANSLEKKGHSVSVVHADYKDPLKSYATSPVLFNNGQNQSDLTFMFPVFQSHPMSSGITFGDLGPQQLEDYIQNYRENIEDVVTNHNPSIVNVHHGWIIGSILSEMDLPYVISLHGTERVAFEDYPNYQEMAIKGLNNAANIIALTEDEKELAIKTYNLDPAKVTVIGSGVDMNTFYKTDINRDQVLSEYGLWPSENKIVLYVGRLTPQKGVEHLIDALTEYSNLYENPVTGLLAGDGVLMQDLQNQAEDTDYIHFLGHKSRDDVVNLMNIADVVVMPSLYEPFGLVACEAIACGTPVIASDIPGGLELQVGGLENYLKHQGKIPNDFRLRADVGDSKQLAYRIHDVLSNDLKGKLSADMQTYAKNYLSWDNTVENLLEVYEEAIDDHLLADM